MCCQVLGGVMCVRFWVVGCVLAGSGWCDVCCQVLGCVMCIAKSLKSE